MATLNKTREGTRNQKRGTSIGHANITIADYDATLDLAELFNIPENAHIVRAHLNVKTAFNAGTSITFTIRLGTTIFVAAISVATTGVKTLTVTPLDSGVGGLCILLPTIVGALPTTGEAELMVEYIEYDKSTGEYTDYSAT